MPVDDADQSSGSSASLISRSNSVGLKAGINCEPSWRRYSPTLASLNLWIHSLDVRQRRQCLVMTGTFAGLVAPGLQLGQQSR
jgi:hypothetical protein